MAASGMRADSTLCPTLEYSDDKFQIRPFFAYAWILLPTLDFAQQFFSGKNTLMSFVTQVNLQRVLKAWDYPAMYSSR